MATLDESRAINERIFEMLTGGQEKQAEDAINDFTRTTVREDSVMERILPSVTITNDELDRQVHTQKPYKVVDKEPGSPAAISVPFGTLPKGSYIKGPRYPVAFDRILTPKFIVDVDELRTWIMDIRQVLSDNSVKDALAELDGKFFSAVDTALGTVDTPTAYAGVAQWEQINDAPSRESLLDALKIIPRTPSHLEAATIVVNNIFHKDVEKFDRGESGGNWAEDVFRNGWSEGKLFGRRVIATIKRNLVSDSAFYMFSDPRFIGKHFELEPPTMFVKKEAFLLTFYTYMTRGAAIGHVGSLGKATFTAA